MNNGGDIRWDIVGQAQLLARSYRLYLHSSGNARRDHLKIMRIHMGTVEFMANQYAARKLCECGQATAMSSDPRCVGDSRCGDCMCPVEELDVIDYSRRESSFSLGCRTGEGLPEDFENKKGEYRMARELRKKMGRPWGTLKFAGSIDFAEEKK